MISRKHAPDDVRRANLSQIVAAQAFGVPLADVRARSRGDRTTARARHVAMYLSHVVFSVHVRAVARIFGRSPTATHHALKRVESLRDDPELNRTLAWLEDMLRSAGEVV
jgi:chromosomal replication initiation ATPase DnaA